MNFIVFMGFESHAHHCQKAGDRCKDHGVDVGKSGAGEGNLTIFINQSLIA